MRILQKTISTLLAAQLLFSFGLCGGLCCVKSSELSVPQSVAQTAEPEENLPPCHRKKAAEKAAIRQEHQAHSAQLDHQTYRTSAANQKTPGKIAASVLNRNCCAVRREVRDGESPVGFFAPPSSKLIAVFVASPRSADEIAFRLLQVPIQISATHSPPHTGFQLSLRI
ncbi:MAG: hypothetical protein KA368_17600 [Acidobacteria bacterium]|nr:hypothetical protein [Acidobacteriota bacterium]